MIDLFFMPPMPQPYTLYGVSSVVIDSREFDIALTRSIVTNDLEPITQDELIQHLNIMRKRNITGVRLCYLNNGMVKYTEILPIENFFPCHPTKKIRGLTT